MVHGNQEINKESVQFMENQWYYSRKKLYGTWTGQPMVLLKKESVWYMANQWYYSRKKLYGIWLTNGTTQERNCMVYG